MARRKITFRGMEKAVRRLKAWSWNGKDAEMGPSYASNQKVHNGTGILNLKKNASNNPLATAVRVW